MWSCIILKYTVKHPSTPSLFFSYFVSCSNPLDTISQPSLSLPRHRNGSHQPGGLWGGRQHPHKGLLCVGVGTERARWAGNCLCSQNDGPFLSHSWILLLPLSPLSGVSHPLGHTANGYRTHLNANANGFSPYQARTMQSELNIHRHYDSRWQASDSRKQAATDIGHKPD